jgi:hypothetical protein
MVRKLVKRLFWSGILIFIPSWALANGLLFPLSTSAINNAIFVLSWIELIGIVLLSCGLVWEFEFRANWKKIVAIGAVVLWVGYWVIPLIISTLYPQFISLDFESQVLIGFLYPPFIPLILVNQISAPSLWISLVPAATEITGTIIILLSAFFGLQKSEIEK